MTTRDLLGELACSRVPRAGLGAAKTCCGNDMYLKVRVSWVGWRDGKDMRWPSAKTQRAGCGHRSQGKKELPLSRGTRDLGGQGGGGIEMATVWKDPLASALLRRQGRSRAPVPQSAYGTRKRGVS